MRKGGIFKDIFRFDSVLARMIEVMFFQGSTKERGTEGAACLRQDCLMICRYFIRISKYTRGANLNLSIMAACHGSLFYSQTNIDKKYILLSLACLLSLFLFSSPTHLPWEFMWNKFNYAVTFLLLKYLERAVFLCRQPAPQLWHCLTISVQSLAVLFFWAYCDCYRFKDLVLICWAYFLPSSGVMLRVNTLHRCSLTSM